MFPATETVIAHPSPSQCLDVLASQVVQEYGLTPARTIPGQAVPQGNVWGQSSTAEEAHSALVGSAAYWASTGRSVCGWRFSNRRPDFLGKRTEAVSLSCKRGEEKDMMFISRRGEKLQPWCRVGLSMNNYIIYPHTDKHVVTWSKRMLSVCLWWQSVLKNKIKSRKEGRKKEKSSFWSLVRKE